MSLRSVALACVLAVLLVRCGSLAGPAAQAGSSADGAIVVSEAWARPAIGGVPTGGYLTIQNRGATPETLLGASTDKAQAVELHSMESQDGVMKMRPVQSIAIPAGGSITLQSGGNHLMIIGLSDALKPGDTFPLTLRFQNAGTLLIQMPIRDE